MLVVAILAVLVFMGLALLALVRYTRTSSEDLTDNLRRLDANAAARIDEQRGRSGNQQFGVGGGLAP